MTLENNTITGNIGNAVYFNRFGTGNVIIRNNSIIGNAGTALYFNQYGAGSLSIENNNITGNNSNGITFNQYGTGNLSVRNNNIANNNGYPIIINLGGLKSSIFSNIQNNIYIGNTSEGFTHDSIALYGSPTEDLTLSSGKYYLTSSISVPSGKTLTIQPGVLIESTYCTYFIDVQGKLNAIGTLENPIVFTVYKDPAYGGSGVSGSLNDYWEGMNISATGEFTGDFVKIKYGASISNNGSTLSVLGKLTLTNSEISNTYQAILAGYGIYFNTTIQPTLIGNSFLNNARYSIYNFIPTLITIDASYNYWGSVYGPNSKSRVSTGVIAYPCLGSECTIQTHFGQDGAYAATGNYSRTFTDMSMDAPGFKINLSRTYNSRNDKNTVLGKGWTFGFEGSIKEYGNNIPVKIVKLPNGSVETFNINNDGTFTANDSRSTLSRLIDGSYVLITKDQYSYGFNASGWLVWMKDKDGNTITIQVDGSSGKVQTITDTGGRNFTLSYNSQGLLETITDPANNTVTYQYENNQLVRVVDSMNHITTYAYDSQGFVSEIRDNDSKLVESIAYIHTDGENKDKVDNTTDAFGNTFSYTYDNANRKVTITDSSGRQTIQWYDSSMNVIISQDVEGRQTITEYYTDTEGINKYSETKSVTDRNGNKTLYERDVNGNITKETNPDSSYSLNTYDDKNNLTSEKDELGKYTFYIYDDQKVKLLKKAQPLNGTDIYTTGCDESNFAITNYIYYTSNESQQLGYAAKGLLKAVVDPENNSTVYTYDQYGNTKSVTDPENRTTNYEYDIMGRMVEEASPGGYVTSYIYDKNGNLEKKVLDGGETTRITYDAEGRKTKEISPNLYESDLDDIDNHAYSGDQGIRYTYYGNGSIHTVTDPESNINTFTYDLYGNVLTETKANGAVYRYEYDVMNRLSNKYFRADQNSSETLVEQYTYTILANKNTQTVKTVYLNGTDTATEISVFNYAGRQISQQNPDGTTVSTSYNANGTINTTMNARSSITYYRYDGLNRLSEQWSPVNAGTYSYKKITYDKAGRQKLVQVGKELVSLYALPSTFITTSYDYYKDGEVKSITDSANRKTDNVYDNDGVLSRQDVYVDSTNKNTTEYVNNHLGKPVEKKVHVKSGDLYGNSFNNTDDTILVTSYTYDKDGNLKTVTTPDNVTTTYFYDKLDRQTGVSRPCKDEYGNDATVVTATTYDWEGKVLTTTDANGNTTTNHYNQRGFLDRITDAGQGITAYYYDTAGRKIAEVSPQNYDTEKNLSEMNRVEYAYDSMGRVKTKSDIYKDSVTNQWTTVISKSYKYDGNGNVIKELDALGYEAGTGTTIDDRINSGYGTEYTYNLADQVSTVLDPVSKQKSLAFSTKYDYDGLGMKITETNAISVVTKYYYDDAGNLLKTAVKKTVNDPEQVIKQAAWDLAGNMTSQTDGNGNTITLEYNALGKPRIAVYPGDSTIPQNTVTYQYDEMGNLKKQQDSMDKVDEYKYDSFGRQISHAQKKADGT